MYTTGVKMGRFDLHHGALIKALRYIEDSIKLQAMFKEIK